MNLGKILRQKLAETPVTKARHDLLAAGADLPWSATITFEKRDELSGLVREVVVTRSTPVPPGETINSWAERIARKTAGLMEPLVIVEIDPQRDEGFLRSAAPSRQDDQVLYYEAFLKGARQATLRRYQAPAEKAGKRTQVAFALTHESLARLVADLTAE
jgi:hypothetical protein